jgi:tetratricopeptide (TPR) repeat protein
MGHEHRAESLNDLGDALFHLCCYHKAEETRSIRCIELLREGLRLRPPGHPLRDQSLHNLAKSLGTMLYQQLGRLDIITECAALNREALQLRPLGHPERVVSLNNLANNIFSIYSHTGDTDSLAEAVIMRRAVLEMSPPGHASRCGALGSLSTSLRVSFENLGGSDTLAEAIKTMREAVELCPVQHPMRFWTLDSLASALALRCIYEGHSDSLTEGIDLGRQAIQLLSDSHPERARIMNNLAESLLNSFHITGDRHTLAEVLTLLRGVVTLKRRGDYYDLALESLATALAVKFDNNGDTEALSEAGDLHREALHFRPIGHPRRFWSLEGLARVLCRMESPSWPEALSCYQKALQACPVGYPARSRLLSGMSQCFLEPRSPFFSLSQGISCLSRAYADTLSHISGRLKSAPLDLGHLEAAYAASTKKDQTQPPTQDDERMLDLYTQVIGLLPLAANFGLNHSARLQALAGCDEVARNAAARAVHLGSLRQAIEMLEQGRGVFWTQTLHLRTTAFDGVPKDDCEELQHMLRLLDNGSRRMESQEQSTDQRERELDKRRQLNEAVQTLITKIRGYPGLDRFLLPPAFGALFGSLPDGFVVILNASRLAHHALLLHRATGLATSLALKLSGTDFDSEKLRDQLPRDMASVSKQEGENETRGLRRTGSSTRCFEDVLALLWTSAVQPVLDELRLNVSFDLVALLTASDYFSSENTRAC